MLLKRFLLSQTRSIAHQPARTFPAYAHPRILNVARTFATPATMSDSVTLPVLDASELKDGEMKQVEFGEGEKKGKVLLVKIGGEVVSSRRELDEADRCEAHLTVVDCGSMPIPGSARIMVLLWLVSPQSTVTLPARDTDESTTFL